MRRNGFSMAFGGALTSVTGAIRHVFAERQILLRAHGRVSAVTVSGLAQAAVAVVALSLVGWGSYVTWDHFAGARDVLSKDRQISALKLAYRDLKASINRSENRFTAMARTLEAKQAYIAALLGRDHSAAGRSAKLLREYDAEELGSQISQTRNELLVELGKLELAMQGSARAEGRAQRQRRMVQDRLGLSVSDRLRMDRERRHLLSRIENLEQRLAFLSRTQHSITAHIVERAQDSVETVKRLIASTGVNVESALARLSESEPAGQGGPFFAAAPDATGGRAVPTALDKLDRQLERFDDIRRLAYVLPLAAPSRHYYVASPFGKRRDPVNRRWAMHYGVDLAGVYRSPVLATAPGLVVKVGRNGSYGRMVEIDHGMGIRTRYAHLRRITVKKGQRVELDHKIGEMGNSGRSTGTHVHYEILVKGKPKDPMKFMRAGKYVLKGF